MIVCQFRNAAKSNTLIKENKPSSHSLSNPKATWLAEDRGVVIYFFLCTVRVCWRQGQPSGCCQDCSESLKPLIVSQSVCSVSLAFPESGLKTGWWKMYSGWVLKMPSLPAVWVRVVPRGLGPFALRGWAAPVRGFCCFYQLLSAWLVGGKMWLWAAQNNVASKNRLMQEPSTQCVVLLSTFSLFGNWTGRHLILSSGVFIKLLRKDKIATRKKNVQI